MPALFRPAVLGSAGVPPAVFGILPNTLHPAGHHRSPALAAWGECVLMNYSKAKKFFSSGMVEGSNLGVGPGAPEFRPRA